MGLSRSRGKSRARHRDHALLRVEPIERSRFSHPSAPLSIMNVNPDGPIGSAGASISHSGSSTLTVTITSDTGQRVTVQVPPGSGVSWEPPPGWLSATFTAHGHAEEFRFIESEAEA